MPSPIYRDATRSTSDRVEDLLAQMTRGEKLAQLCGALGWPFYQRSGDTVELSEEGRTRLAGDGIGGLYGLLRADPWTGVTIKTGLSPAQGARLVNDIQRYIRDNTRLGIPTFVIGEAGHGYMAVGGTIGPTLLTAGQSWNPELWQAFMAVTGREAVAQGNSVVFSPNVDLARDPRWGRVEDTGGEDPYLASRFAGAAVKGLQSEPGIIACAKHFIHGAPRGGLNTRPVSMGRHEMHEVYLRTFRAAIAAGVGGIMPAYSDIDGQPCSADRWLLTDLLRDQLGFTGVTFSDVAALPMIAHTYRIAADRAAAAALSLGAGMDFDTAHINLFGQPLAEALDRGLIGEDVVDLAVRRVLTLKFELGLFDREIDPDRATFVMTAPAHREVSRQVAREGIVLLKNDHATLPFSRDLRRIAVVGPNAHNVYNQLGDYTPPQRPGETTTVLEGIRKLLPTADVLYEPGCAIRDMSDAGIAPAVALAASCDAVVAVVGGSGARDFENEELNRPEEGAMTIERTSADIECGEGLDRATLGLLGRQLELVQQLHATGVPLAAVIIGGRPFEIEWIRAHVDAILFAGYPGQEGGHAIAEVLFGTCNPSGRLTMTWPKSTGQIPLYYNGKPTVDGAYVDMDLEPAFPFAHGLSYGEFRYSDLLTTHHHGEIHVGVDVENISAVAGQWTVPLYIRDEVSSYTRPNLELKGFQRVNLAPGERTRVTFTLGPDELGFYDAQGTLRVEPGAYRIFIDRGPHALETLVS